MKKVPLMLSCMSKITSNFQKKNYIVFGISSKKNDFFALNLQSTLGLKEIRQDNTKGTPV